MSGLKAMLKRHWSKYNAFGQIALTLGVLAMIVDVAISFKYGWSQTFFHGLGFGLVALFMAVTPDWAYREVESKRYISAAVMTCLCFPFLAFVAFCSHLGYSASVRVGDIQQANVTNAVYDDGRKAITDAEAEVAMWKGRIDKVIEQMPWAATVTADGLRAGLASAEKAIEDEANNGGCKAKCKKRMDEKADLESKIASLEQRRKYEDELKGSLAKLEQARTTASKSKFESSTVANQTNTFAQVGQLFKASMDGNYDDALKPSSVWVTVANLLMATGGSIAFLMMAPLGIFVAGRNRRNDVADFEPDDIGYDVAPRGPAPKLIGSVPSHAKPSATSTTTTKVVERYVPDQAFRDFCSRVAGIA